MKPIKHILDKAKKFMQKSQPIIIVSIVLLESGNHNQEKDIYLKLCFRYKSLLDEAIEYS